jgi:hypothetical protein
MNVCRYHGIGGLTQIDFFHYMLSQVLKLNAIISQCQVKTSEVQSAITYKCHLSSCGDLESYDGLQII